MDNSARFLDLLNFMAVLILSVAFHEGAHAWLADRFGDDTPRTHGRMTLNPFAHVHPIMTIAVPAIAWWTKGWILFMGVTPVRPWQMRKPRLHGMLTSLGGPAASMVIGMAFFLLLVGFVAVGGREGRFVDLLKLAVRLNIIGALFNLLPIPPLDGSSVVEFLLPRTALPAWNTLRSYSWILLVVIMVTNVLDAVLIPLMQFGEVMAELGVSLGNWMARG